MSNALVVDYLVDMNTGSVGDNISGTNASAGTQGLPAMSASYTGAAGTMKIAAHANDRLSQVYLRGSGTNFATNATTRRISYDNTIASTYIAFPMPANLRALTVAGWITPGPADAGGAGVLFDYISIIKGGHNCVLQLNNGNGGGGKGYSFNLESDTAGTTHSTYITVVPNTTYWISVQADFTAGTSALNIYDTSGNLISGGSITGTVNTGSATSDTLIVRVGNNEIGTSTAGTISYFEHLIFDYVKAPTILLPGGVSNYWIVKSGSGGGANPPGTGAATAVTSQVANVAANDLIVVVAKWEGGAGSSISCSDGTTSLTASTVSSTTGQANTSGDPRLAVFYLLASVATGTVTYTVTIGASRTFRDMAVFALTPPAGTNTPALDGTNTGATAASGTALSSGNQTTTGTNGMSFGGYAEFGATLTLPFVNGVRPDGRQGSSVGNSVIWCCAYTSGFTGAATGTLSASNRWDAQVISFNATTTAATITIDMWGSVQTTPMARRKIGVVPSGMIGIKTT